MVSHNTAHCQYIFYLFILARRLQCQYISVYFTTSNQRLLRIIIMAFTILNSNAPNFNSNGWCEQTGNTCHTRLMRDVGSLSIDSLVFVRDDCIEAANTLPTGRKAGHYTDMAHYCSMRLNKINCI